MGRVKNLAKFCQNPCLEFSSSKSCQNHPPDMVNVNLSDLDLLFSSNQHHPFYPPPQPTCFILVDPPECEVSFHFLHNSSGFKMQLVHRVF